MSAPATSVEQREARGPAPDLDMPEERPVRRVAVGGFWINRPPVTHAQFTCFVRETSYATLAERVPNAQDYPSAIPEMLVDASMVFRRTSSPVNLDGWSQWWAWAGKSLATEAEWECAARGGLEGAVFTWGDDEFPGGKPMVNSWQGEFLSQNLNLDGYAGTSPVGSFPANGYVLVDISGNVWEWTDDWYVPNPHGTRLAPAAFRRTRTVDHGTRATIRANRMCVLRA